MAQLRRRLNERGRQHRICHTEPALADRRKGSRRLGASVWSDMLGAAFDEVNWDEIANGFLEECEDEADEDSEEEPEKYEDDR